MEAHANFILPQESCLKVRIISPQFKRIQHVSKNFAVSESVAKKRIIRTESNCRAFIRKYFNAEIAEPNNYDIVINTGFVNVDKAVSAIASFIN